MSRTPTNQKSPDPRVSRIRSRKKKVFILTGPPGVDFEHYVSTNPILKSLPLFDTSLGNKAAWRDAAMDAVLITSAPARNAKEYWLRECSKYGFTEPRLFVIDPGKERAKASVTASLARSDFGLNS